MANLAIKGHKTRGSEVIERLEMFGGKNIHRIDAIRNYYVYFVIDDKNKTISSLKLNQVLPEQFIIYSLEEFEEKFPYKVGDKVYYDVCGIQRITTIVKMEYNEDFNDIDCTMENGDIISQLSESMQPYKEVLTMKKKSKLINIEPKLVGNECVHFPIPTDMKLEVKDGMCYLYRDCGEHKESKCLQELKEYLDNATPEQLEEDWKEIEKFSKVGPIADEYVKQCKEEGVNLQKMERKLDEALEKETTESLNKWMDEENMKEDKKMLLGWVKESDNRMKLITHKDYELKVEGNNVYLVKKKLTYPKTYDDCRILLNLQDSLVEGLCGYEWMLISNFQKLLLCRDAYWKIVGEEMGLGKPWEPDLENEELYCIQNYNKQITICRTNTAFNKVLIFPTEEMRDAFYENFKDLIENCKELL